MCGILQLVHPPERSSGVPQAGPKSLHRWPGLVRDLGLSISHRLKQAGIHKLQKQSGREQLATPPRGASPGRGDTRQCSQMPGYPTEQGAPPCRLFSFLWGGGRQTVSSGGFGANLGVLLACYILRALAARSPRSPCPSVTLLSPLKDLQHRQPSEWEVIIGGPQVGASMPPLLLKPFYV